MKNLRKKSIIGSIAVGIAVLGMAFASPYKTGDIVVNGARVQFDSTMGKPVTIDGRTHVPIRIMADALGYETGWNQATKTATVKGEGSTIDLKIDSPRAKINGKDAYIDVREDGKPVLSTTASVKEGRTYVPLRFVTETLGCEVEFKSGVTYINNGKLPVETGDKYFKEMPDIPGKATFNWEKDKNVLMDYFGENQVNVYIPEYTTVGGTVFLVGERSDLGTVDIVVKKWLTDGYNAADSFYPEYAEARGVYKEVFKYFLPKGGSNLYDLIDDGFNDRISDVQSITDVDISSKIGSDGRKVMLTSDESGSPVIRIWK